MEECIGCPATVCDTGRVQSLHLPKCPMNPNFKFKSYFMDDPFTADDLMDRIKLIITSSTKIDEIKTEMYRGLDNDWVTLLTIIKQYGDLRAKEASQ